MTRELLPLGEIIDEHVRLNLDQLVQRCDVELELVIALVHEGALEPRGEAPEEWSFSGPDLIRLQRARRLQRDLEVNLAGVALALDLLDELDSLRQRLRQLES
ncbi:MAG: chaperone modulator CbpM [Thiohalomonadaceae bacterium]